MRQNTHFLILFWFFIVCVDVGFSQMVKGIVIDKGNNLTISDAKVQESISKLMVYTDQNGKFECMIPLDQQEINLIITHPDFETITQVYSKDFWLSHEINIRCVSRLNTDVDLASIQLESTDDLSQSESEVYSLLSSSDEPLLQASAFEFSAMRFRNRGIDNRFDQLGINGFLLNDLNSGSIPYNLLSGQNQLTRYGDNRFSYPIQDYDFGSAGNNQWLECNPEAYRKGLTLNYSITNRSYQNRIGLHYAGRLISRKLEFIAGANRRWAQEGAIPGTFYDAFGFYFGLSKYIGKKSKITFLGFHSPVVRGKSGPVVDEVVQLRNDFLYNPYWGYQEGEKRNSRVSSSSVPAFLLNYDINYTRRSTFSLGFMFLKGSKSNSNIDWFNVSDPRPDYYQYLPSSADNEIQKELIVEGWKNNPSVFQMDWNKFYQTNYQNFEWVKNINGSFDSIYGRRSLYALSGNHVDPTEVEVFARSSFKLQRNQYLKLLGRFESSNTHYYMELEDLLGGDYFLDYGKFILPPYNSNPNILNSNHIVKEGDIYSFNYYIKSSKLSLQQNFSAKASKFDVNVGVSEEINWIRLQNKYQNSIFINSAQKENVLLPKLNLGAKGTLIYKINGRNYIELGMAYHQINPTSNQIYINPAWRYDKLPINDQTKLGKMDVSYKFNAPGLKFKLTGFYYKISNQIKPRNFYLDANAEELNGSDLIDGGFVNGFYTGLNEQHHGLETSLSLDLNSSLQINIVGQQGEYFYTNRPTYYFYDQFSPSFGKKIIYLKNFYVPGSPQTVLSVGLRYTFVRNGSAMLSFNYLDRSFVEVYPLRRTTEAIDGVDSGSELFHSIIDQEKLPAAFLINASIFKNFVIYKKFISLSLNINNALNKKNLVSGGFEQSRFDFSSKDLNKFPNKYFHLQGVNYFFNMNISLN